VGSKIAREHAMAASKGFEERPRRKEAPPLEGAKSLREALAQVTSSKKAAPVHAPDLKETLRTVAPKAQDARSESQQTQKPAGLPESELRSMLAVDEIDGESS
jgi:hypothetical protein